MKQFVLDMSRKTGHYLASGVAIALLTAISVPIYTRLFPPIEMGYFYVVMSVASLVSIPMGLSMASALSRYYYEYHNDKVIFKRFLSTYLFFGMFWGCFVWLLFSCIPQWIWVRYLEPVYLPYVPIALAIGFLQTLVTMLFTIIRVGLSSKLLSSINLLNAILVFGATLLLSQAMHLGILGRMLAQVFVHTGIIFLLFRHMYRADMLTFAFDWRYLMEGFKYSLPLIPNASMAWISDLSDRLLLVYFKLSAAVGTYAFGYDLSGIGMGLLSESSSQVYSPMFYKGMTHNREDFKSKFNRFFTHYVLLMAVAALGLTLFSKEIMRVLAPRSYAKSAGIIQIMAYANLMGAIYKPFTVSLSYLKKTYMMSALSFISAMSNLGMNIFLIPRYGGVGAAWSTFIATFIYTTLAFMFSQQGLPIAYEYGRLSKIFIANFCCLGVYVFAAMQHYSYPTLILVKMACFLSYPLLLWGSGFLNATEKRLIRMLGSLQGIRDAWQAVRV